MTIKIFISTTALIVGLFCMPLAHATPATAASINQLFDTLQIRKNTEAMIKPQQLKQLGLDQDQFWAAIEPQLKQAYQDRLTEEEIQALDQFYNTKEGRSLSQKMPELTQQTYQIALQNVMTHSQISQGLFKLFGQ
ncbi:DUF2059 domain-containing protein [Acinetobacter apis]|uniref:DUF2059 domain-containing protein n=1 Tax=Acinetobacter apis TaxID=1229165 RepID=A0A217EFP8_9GAMM|nr:DUF2059 domain-containing protein [Acinetobacter apis]SNQ29313.1 hypothetical protein SAMN05444584_1260 [Acinetobacter apis]